ncbi:AraC family transcriptional regulator [Paenibacillus sp. JX-17]|uniref:AraC family transcriptional regulator n=1 Tax=Paenibacillus lacisoli TaxID=3064525 RepID=A0ABT9CAH3_9BACL|nr:AraC family transcriptional regulator [Paenibacillus sp. JX-17]MDO7906258.1 AraC family transcriptional regulator [Paenibacillus sp. JX-17]
MHTEESIQRAIEHIEQHLNDPPFLSLEEISGAAAMSVPNLYRQFYALTGHPVKEYIRKRRTSEAASLLRQTSLSSKEIGYRSGFDTYQTFTKTFKKYTGLTPGMYRKAEIIYSFECIRLQERYDYLENRHVTERFPDVKVIHLPVQHGVGYFHISECEEGIEAEAYQRFQTILMEHHIQVNTCRIFGWNVDLDDSPLPHGYQLVAVEQNKPALGQELAGLSPVQIPGGTYAVTWVRSGASEEIVEAWNRLLSEWLPLSVFEWGDHGLLEEFQVFNSQVSRMKLYLPVQRSQDKETLEVRQREQLRVMVFRAEENEGFLQADQEAVQWLSEQGWRGDSCLQVLISSTQEWSTAYIEQQVTVECCIPVRLCNQEQEAGE